MKKIWLVTDGSYSDYMVMAAFETEEVANAAQAAGMGDAVESMTLHTEMPESVSVLTVRCYIPTERQPNRAYPGRKFWESWEHTSTYWPGIDHATPPKCERKGFLPNQLIVEGTDHERVRKTFSDYRAELRASWEWIT